MTERRAYGTAGTTEARAERERVGDGKALRLWKEAAEKACRLHLQDLHREYEASQAQRLVEARA